LCAAVGITEESIAGAEKPLPEYVILADFNSTRGRLYRWERGNDRS